MKLTSFMTLAVAISPVFGFGVEPGTSCVNVGNKKCEKNGGHVMKCEWFTPTPRGSPTKLWGYGKNCPDENKRCVGGKCVK